MIRRHRRVLPARIVALLLLAAMVVLVMACVQLLLGQPPLISFGALAAAGAALQWGSSAVLAAGVVAAVLGLVLLACAWTRGAATVLPLATTEYTSAGATRQSLRRSIATVAHTVDGVHTATATVTPRRVRATVTTPLRDPGDLREQVSAAIEEHLGAIALARTPRTTVRVTSRSN
ncbi:DUF6286 domain-containing protein [Pseudonocardia nantongensis]|uniref:DUF6286 domain-containing protein n=1 Tax=Pseudonocardia nantongensis TaxID=1181885 RepID=UPI00397C39B1